MSRAKQPRVRLLHILAEIEGVNSFAYDVAPSDLAADYRSRRAVERAIQIISEAAKELPEEIRALEPDVPWREIVGIGNLLRHEYYRINDSDMISIVFDDLPVLLAAIQRLLDAGE